MNHSLLTAHTAERIREDLREASENVRSLVLGTAIGTLFALANISGIRSSRAKRSRLRANCQARRAAAEMAEQLRLRTMN